ncbi:hypothetical protein [Cupriavidus necator]|uniref:hypothetical protein n=1 Tax=Cupriavidus necator TaxID=106590 RepID=UPI00339D65D5
MGIIESVQEYDLNIPAGAAQAIDVAGDRIHFLSATDPFAEIEIRPNFAQGNISLKPGQGFRFSEQVTRWIVFNRGLVALTGALMIGSGDFFDQRISGTVDVIDGGKARTLGGVAFMVPVSQSAVAAQYSAVQLFNLAGSGKNLIVEAVSVQCTTAATQIGLGLASTVFSTAGIFGNAKKAGAAASTAARTYYQATAGGPWIGQSQIVTLGVPLSQTIEKKFNEPIVLPPGYALSAWNGNPNQDVWASYEFFEENA